MAILEPDDDNDAIFTAMMEGVVLEEPTDVPDYSKFTLLEATVRLEKITARLYEISDETGIDQMKSPSTDEALALQSEYFVLKYGHRIQDGPQRQETEDNQDE